MKNSLFLITTILFAIQISYGQKYLSIKDTVYVIKYNKITDSEIQVSVIKDKFKSHSKTDTLKQSSAFFSVLKDTITKKMARDYKVEITQPIDGQIEEIIKEIVSELISAKPKSKEKETIIDDILYNEEESYACKLILNESIKVYKEIEKGEQKDSMILTIEKVVLKISDGIIDQIDIISSLGKTRMPYISNLSWGITLRQLKDGGQTITFQFNNNTYILRYSDLFTFDVEAKSPLRYNLKSRSYYFDKDNKEAKLLLTSNQDIFTAAIYSNFWNIDKETENPDKGAEITFHVPINNASSIKHFRWLAYTELYSNLNFNFLDTKNGLVSKQTKSSDSVLIQKMDIINKAFTTNRLLLNVFRLDYKKIGMKADFNVGGFGGMVNAQVKDTSNNDNYYKIGFISLYNNCRFIWEIGSFGLILNGDYIYDLASQNTSRIKDYKEYNYLNDKNSNAYNKGYLNMSATVYFAPLKNLNTSEKYKDGGLFIRWQYLNQVNTNNSAQYFLLGYHTDIKTLIK